MDREQFTQIRDRYLSAARPVQSAEHLKGREQSLSELVDALRSPGRHAFIYGYRGVGKTSLAQTAAFQLQIGQISPVLVSCEPSSTFESVLRNVIVQAANLNPLATPKQSTTSVGVSIAGTRANFSRGSNAIPLDFQIKDVSDAVTFLSFLANDKQMIVVVVDEFDQIADDAQHRKFANLIKQLSDRALNVKIIICGIAESVEILFREHNSIFRQVHATEVNRLGPQARLDIISDALDALKICIEPGLCYRISTVSDGFPSFVHLITEKIVTATFDAGYDVATGDTYEQGVENAVRSVELTLKGQYERAVYRNSKKLEPLIWALAADKFLEVNVEGVWKHYGSICRMLKTAPEPRDRIAQNLALLCRADYGSLLTRPRHANYTFSEKMMRAYARLRAEYAGCQLGEENPDYSKGGRQIASEFGPIISYHDNRR